MPSRALAAGIAALAASAMGSPAIAADAVSVDELVVVGTPLSGGVPVERTPAQTRTIVDAFAAPGLATAGEAIVTRLGGAVSVDTVGNPLQQAINLRGFTAAPALGEPQGVSVFAGPMRINEAFGDVVQWDLLPAFAIAQAQVVSGSNPTYGLNTTGGVVNLGMKTGFGAQGGRGELSAGSFARRAAVAEFGHAAGGFAVYAGADHLREDGWRDASPSRLARAYADLAWRPADGAELGLAMTAADTQLSGNGPAPLDLLSERRRAVFTYPDAVDTRLYAATLRASATRADFSLGAGAFVRHLNRRTLNGDQAEFEECDEFDGFPAPVGALCFGADEDDEEAGDPEIVVDGAGRPVLGLDEPDAVFNRTRTKTLSLGLNVQATRTAAMAGRDNILIVGAAMERADTRYVSGTELGELLDDRGVESLDVAIGNDEFNVGLKSTSRTVGVYVSDTFSLTPDLHLSGSLRWNRAQLQLRDQVGTDLTGDHTFARLNFGAGVAWNLVSGVTVYGSYAENNRAPTPAELSCADPDKPCRFPNAFLADPPLDDVKGRTWELGARGRDAGLQWSASLFRTNLTDDIIFVSAGPIIGSGYFDNVGGTRREGVEFDLSKADGPVSWFVSYALVNATYRTEFAIQAPHNPEADDDGEIEVERGDRIPGQPLHSLKAGAEWQVHRYVTLGADARWTSSRYLRGDEANETKPLRGFATMGLSANWRRGPVAVWARAENLFGAEYASFGIYGEADEQGFDNPRFISPGAPRSFQVGVSASF